MITIIAAVSTDGFIARRGVIPWRLKSDMNLFRRLTTNRTVIMGRITWESLPPRFRPLPDRKNIVLTRQESFHAPGATVYDSLERALEATADHEEVFVMGGAQIYRAALPHAERMLITRVDAIVDDGDVRFPRVSPNAWNVVSRTDPVQATGDEYRFVVEDLSPDLPYIELANVRTFNQLKVMREIRRRGHCPFCPEQLALYHHRPISREGKYWLLTENQWPYPNSDVHLLLISKEHCEHVGSLSSGAQNELFTMVSDLELRGGGLGLRFGDPILSGGTVKHLHAQIVAPKRGAEPIKLHIGANRPAVL